MNLRFDHAVIGVRDLAEAGRFFADSLGFDVYPGGRHTGLGTENAIVRFGLDYLELLGIYDEEQARAAGSTRGPLVEYLRRHACGPLGFALATDDIDGLAARFRAEGLDALGPYPMKRMRPDGVLLEWRLLVPGGTAWRRPWPFFIQWGMADDERLRYETPGKHSNGATGVRGVAVAVRDLAGAQELYSRQLGMTLRDEGATGGVAWARYGVGAFHIDLLSPTAPGDVLEYLQMFGEGLYQVWLESSGTPPAIDFYAQRNLPFAPVRDHDGADGIRTADGCGSQLVLTV